MEETRNERIIDNRAVVSQRIGGISLESGILPGFRGGGFRARYLLHVS